MGVQLNGRFAAGAALDAMLLRGRIRPRAASRHFPGPAAWATIALHKQLLSLTRLLCLNGHWHEVGKRPFNC
jgi:hypothetical protein